MIDIRTLFPIFSIVNTIVEKGEKHFFKLLDVYFKGFLTICISLKLYEICYGKYNLIDFSISGIWLFIQSQEFIRSVFLLVCSYLILRFVIPVLMRLAFTIPYELIWFFGYLIRLVFKLPEHKTKWGIRILEDIYLSKGIYTSKSQIVEQIVKSVFEDVKKGFSRVIIDITTQILLIVYFYAVYLKGILLIPKAIEIMVIASAGYWLVNALVLFWIQRYMMKAGHSTITWMNKRKDRVARKIETSPLVDGPIFFGEQNKLAGRGEFVKALGQILSNHKTTDPLVIGLTGEWGHGKTSALNLLLEKIRYSDRDRKYVVFDFSPWILNDNGQLVEIFLSEFYLFLVSTFGSDRIFDLDNPLKRYLDFFVRKKDSSGLREIMGSKSYDNTVNNTKRDIEIALRLLDKKILIVIDEIDRLAKEEIINTLKMVKAIVNFPNTIFLLPYDKQYLHSELKDDSDLLKKVINLEVPLPPIATTDLHAIMKQVFEVNILRDGRNSIGWIEERWDHIFHKLLAKYIKSVRDINNFIFRLKMLRGSVSLDLNIIDFTCIACIQYFDHELYKFIHDHKEEFLELPKKSDNAILGSTQAKTPLIHHARTKLNESDYHSVIVALFPNLSESSPEYGDNHLRVFIEDSEKYVHQWTSECRIFIREEFDKYFFRDFEQNPILRSELESLAAADLSYLDMKLRIENIFKSPKQRLYFLERIVSYFKSDFSRDKAKKMLLSLIPFYIELRFNSLWMMSSEVYSQRQVLRAILDKVVDNAEKKQLLLDLLNSIDLSLIDFLRFMQQFYALLETDDRYFEPAMTDRTFRSSKDFISIRNRIIEHIRDLDLTIFIESSFIQIIDYYHKLTSHADCKFLDMLKTWMDEDIKNVLVYLKEVKTVHFVSGTSGHFERSAYDLQWMNSFYPNDELSELLNREPLSRFAGEDLEYVKMFNDFFENRQGEENRGGWASKPHWSADMKWTPGLSH